MLHANQSCQTNKFSCPAGISEESIAFSRASGLSLCKMNATTGAGGRGNGKDGDEFKQNGIHLSLAVFPPWLVAGRPWAGSVVAAW